MYDKMSGEEINRAIAERVMGWVEKSWRWFPTMRSRFRTQMDIGDAAESLDPTYWTPTTDHNDAALVLAEIERRGLQSAFCEMLRDIVPLEGPHFWFRVVNATPRQKCIAALAAVEQTK